MGKLSHLVAGQPGYFREGAEDPGVALTGASGTRSSPWRRAASSGTGLPRLSPTKPLCAPHSSSLQRAMRPCCSAFGRASTPRTFSYSTSQKPSAI